MNLEDEGVAWIIAGQTCIFWPPPSDPLTSFPSHSAQSPGSRHRLCSAEKKHLWLAQETESYLDHYSLDILKFCIQVVQVSPPPAVTVGLLCFLEFHRSHLNSKSFTNLYVCVKLYEWVGPGCCVDFVTILIVKLLERWMFLEGTSWNIKFPKFSTSPSPSPSSYRNITEMKKHLDSTCAKSSRKA